LADPQAEAGLGDMDIDLGEAFAHGRARRAC
jgi:hypothetical protein